MVVEIVIAESHPLHIVLTVEQTIIAVFVGSITIEVMGEEGFDYDAILLHYYQGAEIKKVYK